MRVPLLAGLDVHRQPILLGRQGAGGVGRVGAGGIFKPVEVEFENSRLAEAVVGQSGMEEARRLIRKSQMTRTCRLGASNLRVGR